MSNNTKLTNEIRNVILKRLVVKAFKQRLNDMQPREHDIANRMWEAVYGPHAKTMEKLPSGFLRTSSHLDVIEAPEDFHSLAREFAGPYETEYTRYSVYRPRFGKERRVDLHYNIVWDAHPALCEEWAAHVRAIRAILLEQSEFERNAKALLWSVRTRAELVAAWPEVAPMIPEPDRKERLPVPIDLALKLNAQLGIVGARA